MCGVEKKGSPLSSLVAPVRVCTARFRRRATKSARLFLRREKSGRRFAALDSRPARRWSLTPTSASWCSSRASGEARRSRWSRRRGVGRGVSEEARRSRCSAGPLAGGRPALAAEQRDRLAGGKSRSGRRFAALGERLALSALGGSHSSDRTSVASSLPAAVFPAGAPAPVDQVAPSEVVEVDDLFQTLPRHLGPGSRPELRRI